VLRKAGAWWIAGIERKVPRGQRRSDVEVSVAAMSEMDLLRHHLTGQEPNEMRCQNLVARGADVMEGRPALDRGG
jgi:hypothetical protein